MTTKHSHQLIGDYYDGYRAGLAGRGDGARRPGRTYSDGYRAGRADRQLAPERRQPRRRRRLAVLLDVLSQTATARRQYTKETLP